MSAQAPERRIYLDNAATSWPKPESVYVAVEQYQRENGAAAGRGIYREAVDVERRLAALRVALRRMLNARDEDAIVFAGNGTDALNLALQGSLQDGDHVITSVAEHNSVLRPLNELARRHHVDVTRVPVDGRGMVDPDDVARAWRANSRMICLTHASNVTGTIQPIEAVGQIARNHDAFFLVDAAQTLGHLPIDVAKQSIDLLAAPGHKGLLGPLGTGILYVRGAIANEVSAIRQGGTGTESEREEQPDSLPEKFEAGNLNVPGLLGLAAGVEYIARQGIPTLRAHELQLVAELRSSLERFDELTVYGTTSLSDQVGVVSFSHPDWDPRELTAMLDASCRIQTRAGLHCAPAMHRALGTTKAGGTTRVSLGPFNQSADILAFGDVLSALLGSR